MCFLITGLETLFGGDKRRERERKGRREGRGKGMCGGTGMKASGTTNRSGEWGVKERVNLDTGEIITSRESETGR